MQPVYFEPTTYKKSRNYRMWIENILSLVLLGIAIYLILTPFIPMFSLWLSKSNDKNQGFAYASSHPLAPDIIKNASNNNSGSTEQKVKPIPAENRLVIPGIQVDIKIVEGKSAKVLLDGGWRRPGTSTPDKGGNTVIAAHRFLYRSSNASYFYNLDKVKVGDPIIVYWEGKEYDWVVSETKVVKATAVEIEKNTAAPMLTLYTCTPLWTAKDRLVVIAKPI